MIILFVLIMAIGTRTILQLVRRRQWVELTAYSSLLLLSAAISLATALGLEMPPVYTILGKIIARTYEKFRAVFV